MLIFILNKHGKPLMPCSPRQARLLLKKNLAKVIQRTPFTIKLLHGSSGYKQKIFAGMDTGSKTIGCAAIANNTVLYQSEVAIRQDISKKMQQRSMFRRTRRSRKLRYRQTRFNNRKNSLKLNRLPPSIKSKINSHLREKNFIESILPITKWIIELASFDIHKITNSQVSGSEYQQGKQLVYYNVKQYVLHRDGYKCQSGIKVKHNNKLQVHHIIYQSNGGNDAPDNLITLCKDCHSNLHKGVFSIKSNRVKTQHATQVSIIKSQLAKELTKFEITFGYETKFKREGMGLLKTHANDAIAICCNIDDKIKVDDTIYYKKHIAKGDYQQTCGSHSEKRIPTGKLFGLRKFDLVKTNKSIGFIKGKRSSGYFALMDIDGSKLTDSVNVKKDCIRLAARTTTIISRKAVFPPRLKGRGFHAEI